MFKNIQHVGFHLALITALILSTWRNIIVPPAIFSTTVHQLPNSTINNKPLFIKEFLPILTTTPEVHSATLIQLSNNNLLAAWFGGSREGAADVAIYAAERKAKGWSQIRILANRTTSARDLGWNLRKLGNPVLFKDINERIWLFFVSSSLGGWSTSSIVYCISTDNGKHFDSIRPLITSPLLNISTLIRGQPLMYADGSIAIPAYHELLGKFGLAIRLHPNGRILSLTKIGNQRIALQPTYAVINAKYIVALLRRTGTSIPRVLLAHSYDGGINWTKLQTTNLPNPDASIAVVSSSHNEMLLVYNPLERGRHILSLAISNNAVYWRKLCNIEMGLAGDEFSYPFLIHDSFGTFHLVYTWKRHRIAYVQFNRAWLKQYCV